jgi:hypothetical protein
MAADDGVLIPVFMPALVALLMRAEQDKGAPLTEAEVLAIRDGATCVMSPRHAADAVTEARGYDDLVPEDCWSQWQEFRQQWKKS